MVAFVFNYFVSVLFLPLQTSLGSFFQLEQDILEAYRDAVVREVTENPDVDLHEIPRVFDGFGSELDRLEDLAYFLGRPIPVFRRKGVQRNAIDAVVWMLFSLPEEGSDEIDEATGALEVSSGPWEITLGGPATIPVANQSNMPRDLFSRWIAVVRVVFCVLFLFLVCFGERRFAHAGIWDAGGSDTAICTFFRRGVKSSWPHGFCHSARSYYSKSTFLLVVSYLTRVVTPTRISCRFYER